MIYTLYTIGGSVVNDIRDGRVNSVISDMSSSSSFTINLNNYAGYNTNKYNINDEVKIYTVKDSNFEWVGSYFVGNYSNLGSILIGSQLAGSVITGSTFSGGGYYDSGLKAYWKFDTGSNSFDEISNYFAVGSRTTLVNGLLGSALSFNGSNSFVSVSGLDGATAYSVGSYFSVSCWAYPYKWNNGNGTSIRLMTKVDDSNNNYILTATQATTLGSERFMFRVKKGGVTHATTSTGWYGQVGSWHNFIGVYSGGSTYLYINGGSVGGDVDQGMGDALRPFLYIGNRGSAFPAISGLIDEVRFYNYCLSSANISQIYNGGLGSLYASGGGTYTSQYTNSYFNDYSLNISGTGVASTGSSIIGSLIADIAGSKWLNDYAINYTGSILYAGSFLLGSQALGSSFVNQYDNSWVGSTILIGSYISSGNIFTGIIEDIRYTGEGIKDKMELSGRDYSARLMDRTVEPEVYTNLTAGSIVKDILNKYVDGITANNVDLSGSPINRISFNHTPVYDAIKQLADKEGFQFYVDNDKDLHFGLITGSSSNCVFDSSNVLKGNFRVRRDTVFNDIWIYGDRYLDGFKETFTAGSPNGGSIFTLLYKPSNTDVTVGGSVIQPGAIYQISNFVGSEVKYLVNYDDRQIIFVSGTANGDNVPSSGTSVVIDYKRLLPIVKNISDQGSIDTYGKRVKVIVDNNIKDPKTAEDLMYTELEKGINPITEGNIQIDGVANLTPGYTCSVNLPREGITNEEYTIIEANYNLVTEDLLHDHPITIKLNKKLPDFTDKIKEILLDLKKLRAKDIGDSDYFTRYQQSTGSLSINQPSIEIYTRFTGSDYLWGITRPTKPFVWGTEGSGLWLGSYTYNLNLIWSGTG